METPTDLTSLTFPERGPVFYYRLLELVTHRGGRDCLVGLCGRQPEPCLQLWSELDRALLQSY